MISELEIANICHGTYEDGYKWDYLFQGKQNDDIYVGIKRIGDIDVVAFRGSTTLEDWIRNFESIPVYSPPLGFVADGFIVGLQDVFENLLTVIGPNYIVTGHSRGAAIATNYAARMTSAGKPPMALIVLAPPRTGFSDLKSLILKIPVSRAYANKNDPVVAVPPWCSHPYDLVEIDIPPPEKDPWGPIAPHHSELYVSAISKLNPMPLYSVTSL